MHIGERYAVLEERFQRRARRYSRSRKTRVCTGGHPQHRYVVGRRATHPGRWGKSLIWLRCTACGAVRRIKVGDRTFRHYRVGDTWTGPLPEPDLPAEPACLSG